MGAADGGRLICFDLDGVIYSAEPFLGDAYREAIALVEQKRPGSFERVPSTREILDHVGWPVPVILARLFPRVDDAAVRLLYAETLEVICRRVAAREGVLYPGVEQTLRVLRRDRVLAVASNGRAPLYRGGPLHLRSRRLLRRAHHRRPGERQDRYPARLPRALRSRPREHDHGRRPLERRRGSPRRRLPLHRLRLRPRLSAGNRRGGSDHRPIRSTEHAVRGSRGWLLVLPPGCAGSFELRNTRTSGTG